MVTTQMRDLKHGESADGTDIAYIEQKIAIKNAMIAYYTLLARMPHIRSNALKLPPDCGWTTIDIDKLKRMGKTDRAIDFLKYLPCMVHDEPPHPQHSREHPEITPNSQAIYYCLGHTIYGWIDDILPTSGHVVFLGHATTRDGHYLLLDTEKSMYVLKSGTMLYVLIEFYKVNIIEVGLISGRTTVPYEEYEALPKDQKWTAYAKTPAVAWFNRERSRLEHLVHMSAPGSIRSPYLNVRWHFRALSAEQDTDLIENEHQLLADEAQLVMDEDDDDYEASDAHAVSPDDDESSDDSDEGDTSIMSEEVRDLALSDIVLPVEQRTVQPVPLRWTNVLAEMQRPVNMEICAIYRRHGWPADDFDQDQCQQDLLRWLSERESARRTKT